MRKRTLESCGFDSLNTGAQPLNKARDVVLCMRLPLLDSVFVYDNSEAFSETAHAQACLNIRYLPIYM